MKKIALIIAMSSIFTLTACQKEVTEVQKGSTVEVKKQSLSTGNTQDITSDMEKIQSLAMSQESKATDLDQRLNQALQSENEDEIKKLFPEFKTAMLENLAELEKLTLKSTEVSELRSKLNEMTKVGLELQEKLMDENVKPEQLEALQQKGMQLQQEIMLVSQKIQTLTEAATTTETATPAIGTTPAATEAKPTTETQ